VPSGGDCNGVPTIFSSASVSGGYFLTWSGKSLITEEVLSFGKGFKTGAFKVIQLFGT
jgi:hypothetical protein